MDQITFHTSPDPHVKTSIPYSYTTQNIKST